MAVDIVTDSWIQSSMNEDSSEIINELNNFIPDINKVNNSFSEYWYVRLKESQEKLFFNNGTCYFSTRGGAKRAINEKLMNKLGLLIEQSLARLDNRPEPTSYYNYSSKSNDPRLLKLINKISDKYFEIIQIPQGTYVKHYYC